MLDSLPGQKVVAAVNFRDCVYIYTDMGSVIRMWVDQFSKNIQFEIIMRG